MSKYTELARELYNKFQLYERDNGDKFYEPRIEYTEELSDLIHRCHRDHILEDIFPDDYKYLFIVQSLEILANTFEGDASPCWDLFDECVSNHDLVSWLASRTDRYLYCDETKQTQDAKTMSILRKGYELERRLVFNTIVEYLDELETESSIACPLCESPLRYNEVDGTHIWSCLECSAILFEYYTDKDVRALARKLNATI